MNIFESHVPTEAGEIGWRDGSKVSFHFAGFAEEFADALGSADGFLQLAI